MDVQHEDKNMQRYLSKEGLANHLEVSVGLINKKLKEALSKKGFTHPTLIQEKSIQQLIKGKDMVGIAETGTGKTAAFLIPIIEQLLTQSKFPSALIIVPTRELALQVEKEFFELTPGMGLRSASFIGGKSIQKDLKQLSKRNHVVIGTPGRLTDLNNRGVLNLRLFTTLVLDEFDRMLDMGFIHDIRRIVGQVPKQRQTLMFSATFSNEIRRLADGMLRRPETIDVAPRNSTVERIEPGVVVVIRP